MKVAFIMAPNGTNVQAALYTNKTTDPVYTIDTGLTLTDLSLSDELNVAALHRAVRKHLPALRALAAASGELPE